MTISFCIALTSQPVRMNSVASQSSSSGCEGHSPCAPKSSTVFTMPVPKYICQKRFTVTRAEQRIAGIDQPFGEAQAIVRSAGGQRTAARRERPAARCRRAYRRRRESAGAFRFGPGISAITITVGKRALELFFVRAQRGQFASKPRDLARARRFRGRPSAGCCFLPWCAMRGCLAASGGKRIGIGQCGDFIVGQTRLSTNERR